MKFRIIADGHQSFGKSGMLAWSKLGFKFKYDKEYKVWWLDSDTKEYQNGIFIDFKTPEEIVKFLKSHGYIHFEVDEKIPTITI